MLLLACVKLRLVADVSENFQNKQIQLMEDFYINILVCIQIVRTHKKGNKNIYVFSCNACVCVCERGTWFGEIKGSGFPGKDISPRRDESQVVSCYHYILEQKEQEQMSPLRSYH